ncbi:MAG: NAD(P)/FAD-dependent oxidoreductase, partial [Bacillota bacterium]
MKTNYDLIVVGTGPTGIFTVLELIEKNKNLDILMLEKGDNLEDRICPMNENPGSKCANCERCAIVSGWGGAGAYSDGKLSLTPQIGGNLNEYIGWEKLEKNIKYADELYLKFGAPDRIFGGTDERITELKEKAIKANLKFIPTRLRHLGTGYSQTVLQNMQDYIKDHGVDIKFRTNVIDLIIEDEKIKGVKTKEGESYFSEYVVTAPGRENAEWLSNKAKKLGIDMTINPVDIGVRVETSAIIAEELTKNMYESKLIYRT